MLIFVSQTVISKYHKMALTIDIYFLNFEGWKAESDCQTKLSF